MTRETLTLPTAEVRFAVDEANGTLEGYASVFGELDAFGDIVMPGTFRRTLAEHRARRTSPALLWSHDPSQPIGVWTSLVEDERGLRVTGKLVTETARGAEALALLKAGALNGLSIGFNTRVAERGPKGRIVKDVDLHEVSIVVMPAAPGARITSVKGAADRADVAAFTQAARRAALHIRGL